MGTCSSRERGRGEEKKIDPIPPFVPYSCRLEIIGGPKVGKKSFLDQFMDPSKGDHLANFNVSHAKRHFQEEEKLIKFGQWDAYADGVIAVYSIDSLPSFIGLVDQVISLHKSIPVIMVGNKADIGEENRQTPKAVDRLLEKLGEKRELHLMQGRELNWMEVSARTGSGVERVVEILGELIFFERTRMIYIKPSRRVKEIKEETGEEKGQEKEEEKQEKQEEKQGEEKQEEEKGEEEVEKEGGE